MSSQATLPTIYGLSGADLRQWANGSSYSVWASMNISQLTLFTRSRGVWEWVCRDTKGPNLSCLHFWGFHITKCYIRMNNLATVPLVKYMHFASTLCNDSHMGTSCDVKYEWTGNHDVTARTDHKVQCLLFVCVWKTHTAMWKKHKVKILVSLLLGEWRCSSCHS